MFTSARYDDLPGEDFPGAPDSYPTKDQVADYLAGCADRHAFQIQTNTRVTRLVPYDGGLAAHTTQGIVYARQVAVVATGAFQVPVVPALDGSFPVPTVHSSGYRRPADLPQGRVLVVGGANSGLQIAEELVGSREVVLAAGTNLPAVPQRLLGRDLFWWLTRLGVMDKGTDSRLVRRMRDRGDPTIGISRKALRKAGVDLRPRLLGASGRTASFADGSSVDVDAVVWAVLVALRPGPGECAVDLYSGVGLFAAALASRVGPGGQVVAVEADPRAAADARRNLHDVSQVRLVRGRADRDLARLAPPKADIVVLDPPRTGAGRRVVEQLAALAPRGIAYVACDPAALARDVATFAALGYRLASLRAFDLFPMTSHVECVAHHVKG